MTSFGPPCPPCRFPDDCACESGVAFQEKLAAERQEPKLYHTIVVDPPWKFSDNLRHYLYRADREGRGRGAAANYAVMELEEVAGLPVGCWAEGNAHLYLWTTNGFMEEAYQLVHAWGFTPKTILTWVKTKLGMGYYFRNNTEHVVFAVRGSLPTLRKDCRTAFTGAQGRHSEKPAAFYDIVESMSPGPYLDVFARKLRFNWDAWGDEVGAPAGLPTPDQVRARLL